MLTSHNALCSEANIRDLWDLVGNIFEVPVCWHQIEVHYGMFFKALFLAFSERGRSSLKVHWLGQFLYWGFYNIVPRNQRHSLDILYTVWLRTFKFQDAWKECLCTNCTKKYKLEIREIEKYLPHLVTLHLVIYLYDYFDIRLTFILLLNGLLKHVKGKFKPKIEIT